MTDCSQIDLQADVSLLLCASLVKLKIGRLDLYFLIIRIEIVERTGSYGEMGGVESVKIIQWGQREKIWDSFPIKIKIKFFFN